MLAHIISKQLHDKGGDAAIDADEDVDAGENYICCAGDLKEEGGWVHQRRDGPAGDRKRVSWLDSAFKVRKTS